MKYTAFFILGLIIFITPFLGITTEWKLLITRICGAIIMLGVVLRHYYIDSLRYENQAFDEDAPEDQEEEGVSEDNDADLSREDIEVLSVSDLEGGESNDEEVEDDEMSCLEDRSV